MPQSKNNASKEGKETAADSTASSPAGTKVTLVKPAQKEEDPSSPDTPATDNSISPKAYARPKVGRPSPSVIYQPKASTAVSLEASSWQDNNKIFSPERPDMAVPRPWDYKFALVLAVLFIGVNLGLVMLLHGNHSGTHPSGETVAIKSGKSLNLKSPEPRVQAETDPNVTLPVPPALPSLSPSAAGPAAENLGAASAGLPVLPHIPAMAVPPVEAPVAAIASPAAVSPPMAAAQATAPASAPSAPVVATPASQAVSPPSESASPQELLSIISKN